MLKPENETRIGEASHLAKQEVEGYSANFEDAFDAKVAQAKADGFEVVQSDSTTLLLDLDTEHAQSQFWRVLPIVEEHFCAQAVETWKSKSGNLHVKVILRAPLGYAVRVALQASLGSDGVRESLSLLQHYNGVVEPSVLFKPKPEPDLFG